MQSDRRAMSNRWSLTIAIALLCVFIPSAVSQRKVTFTNRCKQVIWVATQTNNRGAVLQPGTVKLNKGASFAYNIPKNGWAGRFWPKTGCDSRGNACAMGQSTPPCPRQGCQPPAETKIEFFFPGGAGNSWYDISLVDGYSLAADVIPNRKGGSCVRTNCRVSMGACPSGENGVGDLRVRSNGKVVACLSPCKRWNFPSPFGLGRSEQNGVGRDYCCPTPPVSSPACRRGPVVRTKYVNLIHRVCPTAYSYAYDDVNGLHNCPADTSFKVNFC